MTLHRCLKGNREEKQDLNPNSITCNLPKQASGEKKNGVRRNLAPNRNLAANDLTSAAPFIILFSPRNWNFPPPLHTTTRTLTILTTNHNPLPHIVGRLIHVVLTQSNISSAPSTS